MLHMHQYKQVGVGMVTACSWVRARHHHQLTIDVSTGVGSDSFLRVETFSEGAQMFTETWSW